MTQLAVYFIPNFPDPATSAALAADLSRREGVGLVETTLPVNHGFSSHANATIKSALTVAERFGAAEAARLNRAIDKPTIGVLYRPSYDAAPLEDIAPTLGRQLLGVLSEWDEPAGGGFESDCRRAGLRNVPCCGPAMDDSTLEVRLSGLPDDGIVYLMTADATGGALYPVDRIAGLARRVKAVRPGARLAAGFGIRGPEEVRALGAVQELEFLLVGTAYLANAERGATAAARFLDLLEDHLQ